MQDTKVAIATGAGSGIGAATARRLAADGWAVVAVDRVGTVEAVAAEHESISACVCDLAEEAGNRAMVDAALRARKARRPRVQRRRGRAGPARRQLDR